MANRKYRVAWPEGEAIPRSVEEALALGWKVEGENSSVSDDERTTIGTATLRKTVGLLTLYLDVPVRTEVFYGQPESPVAIIGQVEEDASASALVARLQAGLDGPSDGVERIQ
jgi:hypothetical protein